MADRVVCICLGIVCITCRFVCFVCVLLYTEEIFYHEYLDLYGFNPFAPGNFAEKRVLKLVEWFSGHCCAIKS